MTATKTRPGSTRCRPRFATPRDERFPTHGTAVGEIARRLGRPLMPWQQDLVDVAYEYDPASGLLRYDEADIVVHRQAGKTTITLAKKIHRLTVMARQLGPQRSTYTAQTRLAARKKLERDFAELLRASSSFREVTNAKARPSKATDWRLSLNNGSEAIQFGRGSFLQIDAPSRTGGHGDTLDDGTIDEAFAHEDDTVEASMRPAMATRRNAQLWVISTAGDGQSKYLWRKVLAGRAAHEAGRHGRVCYVEYSAADDADPGDPATWRGCMPALGITITEDFVRSEWERAQRKGQEGIDTFCRAYLNQWPEVPVLEEEVAPTAFDVEAWAALADPDAPRGGSVVFGVDIGADRVAHVAVAWRRDDGDVQVMLADTRLSPLQTPVRLNRLAEDWHGPVMLGGPSAALEGDVRTASVVSAMEFAAACGRFGDLLRDRAIRHGNQPPLNDAVRAARLRSYGAAGEQVLDLRDAPAVGPLAAVVRALHGLLSGRKAAPAAPVAVSRRAAPSETADLTTLSF